MSICIFFSPELIYSGWSQGFPQFVLYHGVTYLRTLSFEVLNFTLEMVEITWFFFFYDSIKELLNLYILVIKHAKPLITFLFLFLQLLCQMTLTKISSITHRQNRYLSSAACSLYGKLHVKCTCVARSDICQFQAQWFSISILAIEKKNFCHFKLIRVSHFPLESLCSVLCMQNILYAYACLSEDRCLADIWLIFWYFKSGLDSIICYQILVKNPGTLFLFLFFIELYFIVF